MAKAGPWIRNASTLLGGGWRDGKALLVELLDVALSACDPSDRVRELIRVADGQVFLGSHRILPPTNIHFIGAGKASAPIAEAVEAALGARLAGGLVVLKRGQVAATERISVQWADHPVPSRDSLTAGQALMDYLRHRVKPGDVVIAGFTGGSSALAAVPPESVPWDAKVDLHRLLLASGASINEINTVRKHVSQIKGGRLAALRPDVTFYNMTVSDVAGDALDLITDPTVLDSSRYEDAVRVLRAYDLWDSVHPTVRRHLLSAPDPVEALPQVQQSWVLVSGTTVANTVGHYLDQRHPEWPWTVFSTTISGEAREVGRVLGAFARERAQRGERVIAILAGGETTVRLSPQELGQGGPNLELALAFAIEVRGYPRIALASIDSDGQDGSTSVAGALVDGETVKEVKIFEEALRTHQSLKLAQAQCGIETGQTRTNVNDITLVVVG
ncbi:MAG: DUF4147 domain-containing protein [Firmicutes bacterium]|nr:DUF4147 domain-containing protein [Bacillota bacterium]